MNALTRSATRIVLPRAQTAVVSKRAQSTMMSDFKKHWLCDVGAYPVIGIIGFAIGFCTYTGCKNLAANKDVRIAPSKRQSVIREG
mmetsp:Transcript_17571/g.24773  ORF Transcript_17571/g.24773 Transcript_17571/m.24773 type:complete len:86 (+) Transcript_17571:97-354(+)